MHGPKCPQATILPACLSNRPEILIGMLYLKKDSSNSIGCLDEPLQLERVRLGFSAPFILSNYSMDGALAQCSKSFSALLRSCVFNSC
ncbi:hypothetical protein CEXT_124891 [Caerostris extrusa]|uniref:Uncharacterized protein n=1 Tax=Caerostris extrusa TaxID=172846 RepID=A0AAV4S2K2_CAEEX|nr:hypothetical protein CEXT_124891 [Caerostris extrusa]